MQLRKLRYFIAVAEAGSITAAAERLRMTQPALSRQIRTFEDECGWVLLERGAKSIRLTRAGEVVQREGTLLLAEVDRRVKRIEREIGGGAIRIGYAPSLGGDLLKRAMGCFVQRHPDVKIDLVDATTEEMRSQLASGQLDLMIGAMVDDRHIEWCVLREKAILLAVPKASPLARKKVLKPAQLDGERLLLLSRHGYPEYWKGLTDYFHEQGINAKVAGEFDGIDSLRVAIEAGIGMAFVAESSKLGPETKLVALKPSPAPVRVGLGWRNDQDLPPIHRAFVEELKQIAGASEGRG